MFGTEDTNDRDILINRLSNVWGNTPGGVIASRPLMCGAFPLVSTRATAAVCDRIDNRLVVWLVAARLLSDLRTERPVCFYLSQFPFQEELRCNMFACAASRLAGTVVRLAGDSSDAVESTRVGVGMALSFVDPLGGIATIGHAAVSAEARKGDPAMQVVNRALGVGAMLTGGLDLPGADNVPECDCQT